MGGGGVGRGRGGVDRDGRGGDGKREGSIKCRERHTSRSEVHFHSLLRPTSAH